MLCHAKIYFLLVLSYSASAIDQLVYTQLNDMFYKLSFTNDNESNDERSTDEDSNRTIRDMVHEFLYSLDEDYDCWDDVIANSANMLNPHNFVYNGKCFERY